MKKGNLIIVLKVCTDSQNGELANSIISGWKISEKRLANYVRNKRILYRKDSKKSINQIKELIDKDAIATKDLEHGAC